MAAVLLVAAVSLPAAARPTGPRTFCDSYADAPFCAGRVPSCTLCHQGPPSLNAFGLQVGDALQEDPAYTGLPAYDAALPAALARVEGSDADQDGLSNLEELLLGTMPGDAASHFRAPPAQQGENAFYDVGAWDPAFALRRVKNLFCGAKPSFDEVQAVRAAREASPDEARALVHEALSACLTSEYWRKEALHRMADARIRPLEAVGYDGIIPLADYRWDYRLFSYVLTDGRDARDLLRADYHVVEDDDGAYVRVDGVVANPPGNPLPTGGQPLDPTRRAGMITTQWFLMIHTMFSALPRTTAAQAYRAYLGADIARGEGILPVEGEPLDVDGKGVAHPTCAVCHSTLDPLSYSFAAYQGIGRLSSSYDGSVNRLEETGTYDPARTPWGESGLLLGAPVADLVAWSIRAAESDEFKRNLVLMFWRHALGRDPSPGEEAEFQSIWRALPDDAYSADALLHRLVDTDAFGVP